MCLSVILSRRGGYTWSHVLFWGGGLSISGLRSLFWVCMGQVGLSRGVGMSPTNTPSPVPTDTKWWPRHIWSASGQYTSCRNAFFLPPANEVWGKLMLLHLCVILFTEGGGRRLPPGESASRGLVGQTPAPPNWILRDTVNERAVRILLECILVRII